MELAFVLLFVLLGAGAIVYAGLHTPPGPAEPVAGSDAGAPLPDGDGQAADADEDKG